MNLPFPDRASAGKALARALQPWRGQDSPLVLALPRGGVPVACEIASALAAELDVFIVRKLGTPGQPELAMGAIASGGIRVMNDDIVRALDIPQSAIERTVSAQMRELERRSLAYRGQRPPPEYAGRTLILVDDGVATGATMRAALAGLHTQGAARIVVAVPVAPPETVAALQVLADAVVCLETPAHFGAIGRFYREFPQLTDAEVCALLARAWARQPPPAPALRAATRLEVEVEVDAGDCKLAGMLELPARAAGLIVFAHGSGSGRTSPRNLQVAGALQRAGFATLLFDLLTPAEQDIDTHSYALRFDIPLLARRLTGAVDWVAGDPRIAELPLGLFGASTGAAAALVTAAARPRRIAAVVARGGRPDLASEALPAVRAPTLLIVGERDHEVLDMNRGAARAIGAECVLEIVAGATHLFPERGALERVARLAADWFRRHLGASRPDATGTSDG